MVNSGSLEVDFDIRCLSIVTYRFELVQHAFTQSVYIVLTSTNYGNAVLISTFCVNVVLTYTYRFDFVL